ncbi:GIY-YIG nuclease family protein [Candidatus Odyssella acanthamoebae]|uniref:GIY-YIG domain-containing protein n=1 Tax=Candidatus Odyssella acanthamoebae TaxID=91604 RepID=A0A077B0Q4_9PROT|nr:GIY-YIG nuclease family protein [Candidatus Paracaedibacter acanthamoebae]AIK96500.1 hypothetical protein ID47_06725 [Candidatus Paracaedibacter acanthamoebae]AIK96501.1 hypothetical protein ID47_06730 [Candidatus Paracaedibacter acanthamoebae]
MKQYYLYILASRRQGVLYIGSTTDLIRRVFEHKSNAVDGFTKRYGVHQLVYYEIGHTLESVRYRELQMKKWMRQWKIDLIEKDNKEWRDLYYELI